MTPERWAQIRQIFDSALQRTPADRSVFLVAACRNDEDLRREVESLLVQHRSSGEFLDRPVWEYPGNALIGAASSLPEGITRIGHYQIVGRVGEGGMGIVYEAEQEKPRRTVALKLIKAGRGSPETLRRFEQETQALGRLQHPGIAQIYEAGTADTGFGPQPYFAMEFIRGRPLRDYVQARHLDTRQKLRLIVKICEAVNHAHQRGIIHRDLKPGNILVDETGQPKILDFGVARVTDSEAQVTRQTDLGQLVGTLAYMSPEQVLGDPLELDTRSDVYALGVILYELLAGRLPYSISQRLHEAVETIRDSDPAPLSSINRSYRGDIETIVAKALEKDKTRRYGSAEGLADDIRRYLTEEPIAARPLSARYQLQKFARRNRPLVAGVAAVLIVLVGGIVISTREAQRARRAEQVSMAERDRATREKQRADEESAVAKAVNDFLQNDLLAQASASAQAGPQALPDPDLKVRTALDRAAARIEGKFEKQPLVEASIRETIAETYEGLGLYPQAQKQVERAVELRRHLLGESHPDTLTSMEELAGLYADQDKYALAEPLNAKVLEVRRHVLGPENPDTLTSMNDLALVYLNQGKYGQAEPLFAKALEIRRRTLGDEHLDTLSSMHNLALLYRDQRKYGLAEPLYSKVVEVRERILGQDHPATLLSMNNLAVLYGIEGKYPLAEPLYAKIVEIQPRVLGKEHPDTLLGMSNLAACYVAEGKYAKAGPLYAKVLGIQRRVLGEENSDTLESIRGLAWLYLGEGEYNQAELLLARVLQVRRRTLGEQSPATVAAMSNLAMLYRREGRYAPAESLLTKVLEIQRRSLGPQHPETADSMAALGDVFLEEHKYSGAGPLLREALNTQQMTSPDSWQRYYSESLLGASLSGQKQFAKAELLLLSGYDGMGLRKATIPFPSRWALDEAGQRVIDLYQAWRKPEKAQAWREKLRPNRSAIVRLKR